MDFPAVTICNLNRVNCHNAFIAMYNIKVAMQESGASTDEYEELRDNFNITRALLSEQVSNCMMPVCQSIKDAIGTTFEAADDTENLFMLLENGCELSPGKDDRGKFCQFLLKAAEDIDNEYITSKANRLYEEVKLHFKKNSFKEIKISL